MAPNYPTAADFTGHFRVPDRDLLNKIQVTSLPANGTLLLSNVPVVVNEEIPAANLGNQVIAPTLNWSGSTSFGWNGSDGLVYANTGALVNITLSAVNDSPVNTVPAGFSINEDTPLTGLIFAIANLDAGSVSNFAFTLSALNGSLTLTNPAGLTLITGGNGTSLMTHQGTLTAINAALGEVTYQGSQNYAGAETLTLVADDNGNTGTGSALTDTDPVAVIVNPINDAPTLTAIGNQAMDELVELTFDANANDVEGNTLTFSLDPGAPSGANIDSSTGVFTWTPTETQGPGTHPLTVHVTDNGFPALNDFEAISVTVHETNLAPHAQSHRKPDCE